MDLRNLPQDMSAHECVDERRARIENKLDVDLSALVISNTQIGQAEEKNCEQMFGAVLVPVGLAGPLKITFSSGETRDVYLPLATTEGALVASVNRAAKALSNSGGVRVSSEYVGITRSIAFAAKNVKKISLAIRKLEKDWKQVAEATSKHLKILSYDIDASGGVVFLTIAADTDEAMGMNMITIAAQAAGEFIAHTLKIKMLTVAGNVDSDKKPSRRTKKYGRGYRVHAEAVIDAKTVRDVLKSDIDDICATARAKLDVGTKVAGALGKNLHAANVVAAAYLALGQDVAHVVEGSLADTTVRKVKGGVLLLVDLPAVLVGVRGGGTELPAQKQCLNLILKQKTTLRPSTQLAETIGAAVLAGELSLLAAQATNTLARSHKKLARGGA